MLSLIEEKPKHFDVLLHLKKKLSRRKHDVQHFQFSMSGVGSYLFTRKIKGQKLTVLTLFTLDKKPSWVGLLYGWGGSGDVLVAQSQRIFCSMIPYIWCLSHDAWCMMPDECCTMPTQT